MIQKPLIGLWERHEKGAYNHTHALWTYVQPALSEVTFDAINPYRHIREDKKDTSIRVIVLPPTDIDAEGIASLDSLERDGVVTPIDWHLRGHGEQESSLSVEEQELAEKLIANLTDEELEVLYASVGRSLRRAAESLAMPYATYQRRLRKARARAKALAASHVWLSTHLG